MVNQSEPSVVQEAHAPFFEPFDVVALTAAWPEAALEPGVWGTVLAFLGGDLYEVEFTDKEGEPIATARVPDRLLRLIWSEPA